jgi:simple sugar transport system permease protein
MATPLILVGLSVGFSFKTGLFNIGVIGQFTVGAYVAIVVGGLATFVPAPIHWLVAILCAAIAGALWALIPGIMKAYFEVSEIITTIMMNYIALYLVNQLVATTYYDKTTVASAYVKKSALMPKLGLDQLFPGSSVNSGLFIAIIVAIIAYIVLYKTAFGYSLRACGFNRNASRYAGINEKKNFMTVMLVCGLVAGLAGGMLYLSTLTKNYKISEDFIMEASYGIPIALLGNSHPIGIIFAGLFVAYMLVGGSLMQGQGFPVVTVSIITAVIIYFCAFSHYFRLLINNIKKIIGERRGKGKTIQNEAAAKIGGEK